MKADRQTNFGNQCEILGVWCDENPCLTRVGSRWQCISIVLSSKSVIVQSNISKQYFINLVFAFIKQPKMVLAETIASKLLFLVTNSQPIFI